MSKPYLNVPQQLQTKRLIIRCPEAGDGTALYEAIRQSQAHLATWLSWAEWPGLSLKRAEASILRNRERFLNGKDMTMLIFLKEAGTLIGGTGLHNPDWNVPRFEVGYWQHVSFCGRGYMTEAVNAVAKMAIGQLGAKRLHLECYPHNQRSIALAQRCGFHLEARLAAYRRHHQTGELHDWLIFARIPGSGD